MKAIKIGLSSVFILILLFICGFSFKFFTVYLPNFNKLNVTMDAKTFFQYRWFGSGYKNLSAAEFKDKVKTDPNTIIIDLRKKDEYDKFHLENAISGPFDELIVKQTIPLDKNQDIILTCYHGNMSRVAAAILRERGYERVFSLIGSIDAVASGTD